MLAALLQRGSGNLEGVDDASLDHIREFVLGRIITTSHIQFLHLFERLRNHPCLR